MYIWASEKGKGPASCGAGLAPKRMKDGRLGGRFHFVANQAGDSHKASAEQTQSSRLGNRGRSQIHATQHELGVATKQALAGIELEGDLSVGHLLSVEPRSRDRAGQGVNVIAILGRHRPRKWTIERALEDYAVRHSARAVAGNGEAASAGKLAAIAYVALDQLPSGKIDTSKVSGGGTTAQAGNGNEFRTG